MMLTSSSSPIAITMPVTRGIETRKSAMRFEGSPIGGACFSSVYARHVLKACARSRVYYHRHVSPAITRVHFPAAAAAVTL